MQWDVIVAGGGPSGLTLAAELAGSGARTLVLERRQGGVQSRAGTVLPRLLELFDARGIAERFIERTREIAAYPFRPTHIWAGFTPIEWRHLETRFGFTLGLPQNHTEDILRQWAGDSGAEIRHGTALQAFREDGDGVQVEALDASGESHTLRARYLVGADGGRSTVRELGGFAFEGHAGTFRGIAVDAELEAPWPGGRIDIDNHMGWVRGYVFGAGITRFNIVHRDRRYAPRDEPVTLDEVRQCIRDVHGTDYGIERLRWASRFDDQMRAVPCLRRGRVFLVGESARVHYPASGVGMNFCLQDAFNLGWKMANVIQGVAPESTLDSYHAERYPVMQALLASVRAQCALQFNFSPEGVALKRRFAQRLLPLPEVQRQLVRELCGLENPYDTGPGSHALAGRCLPDFDVITLDGRSQRVAQMLRNRRFVLLDLEGYSGQFAQLDLTGLPVDLVPARLGRPPASMTGVKALLIRPDAYVDWASDELAGTAQLEARLARWFER